MKKIILIILITFCICACNSSQNKVTNKPTNDVISKEQMEKLMEDDSYVIVDVRTESEFEESHIVGAINIPYIQIDENVDLDKNKNIFVYCYSGGRSALAAVMLKDLGYTVFDLGAFSQIDLPKE